jgi:Family of unknown function (DUF6962)
MRLTGSATELTTAATDVVLSLAAAGGVLFFQSLESAASWKMNLWSCSFALIALASAFGAVYHGLVLPEKPRNFLWQILTLNLGMAISLFGVGIVYDVSSPETARQILPVLLVAGGMVFAVSRILPGLFRVFILYEAAALIAALTAYAWLAGTGALRGAGWMSAGMLVSMLAAGIQTVKRLHVRVIWNFDHNGIFHLMQAVGLLLISMGLSRA